MATGRPDKHGWSWARRARTGRVRAVIAVAVAGWLAALPAEAGTMSPQNTAVSLLRPGQSVTSANGETT